MSASVHFDLEESRELLLLGSSGRITNAQSSPLPFSCPSSTSLNGHAHRNQPLISPYKDSQQRPLPPIFLATLQFYQKRTVCRNSVRSRSSWVIRCRRLCRRDENGRAKSQDSNRTRPSLEQGRQCMENTVTKLSDEPRGPRAKLSVASAAL